MKDSLTWIELSKKNFIFNLRTIRRLIGKNVILAPCIKANAYGHGLVESAEILYENGADWLCVDTVDEGLLLRENKIHCPILIMGFIHDDEIRNVVSHGFRIFLYDLDLARKLSRESKRQGKIALVHLKVDTGMSRQGVMVNDLKYFINAVLQLPCITIEGIATHLATSDELIQRRYYNAQKKKFAYVVKLAKNTINSHIIIHCANSGAALTDTSSYYNFVRPGIIVYGYYPSAEVKKMCIRKKVILHPVLSLNTKIVQVKNISKGQAISYGATYIAKKNMKIAVLPVGYYDGIARAMSNVGSAIIHRKRAKICGRVCMNLTMVDVTSIANVKAGDTAVIIGKQGKQEITADEIAKLSHTNNYEVITRLRESAKRIVI